MPVLEQKLNKGRLGNHRSWMQKFIIFAKESAERNENILKFDGRVVRKNRNIQYHRLHQLQ